MDDRAGLQITSDDLMDPALVQAFWRYEVALQSNDVTTLNVMFADSPRTSRTDGRQLLVGHAAIADFRSARGGGPSRRLQRIYGRMLADGVALMTAVTADEAATGTQTQVWQRRDDGWRIIAAHVSLPAPPSDPQRRLTGGEPDPAIWRVHGYPLVRPQAPGPLDQVGVAVKDLFAVAGQPTGAGNPTYLSDAPINAKHASVLSRLLDLGAHVVGINPTDEFAYSLGGDNQHSGTPENRAAPGHLPGGSSGATAAAIAAGLAELGLGTDTAGSIRVPASYQGLFGLRTTHGAITTDGLLPLAPSYDSVGLLTRDPRLLTTVTEALLHENEVRPQGLLVANGVDFGVEAPVTAALADRLHKLRLTGVLPEAEMLDLDPQTVDEWQESFRLVQGFEAWRSHGEWIARHPGTLGADVAERFHAAAAITGQQAEEAAEVLTLARQSLRTILATHLIALPSAPGGAPPLGQDKATRDRLRGRTLRLTCLASIAAAPAVSLPILRDGQLPVGLSIISAPHNDVGLARLSADIWDEATA